jgi:hypothetical protein
VPLSSAAIDKYIFEERTEEDLAHIDHKSLKNATFFKES